MRTERNCCATNRLRAQSLRRHSDTGACHPTFELGGAHPSRAHTLESMAVPHAIPGQVIDVRPLGARFSGEKTTALFKSNDLEVMRIVLQAGRSLPPHKVAGEITVHCLEGSMSITTEGKDHVLRAGEMLYLTGGAVHGALALEDTSALVTVALVK